MATGAKQVKRAKNYIVMLLGLLLLGVGLLVKGTPLAAPATATWLPAGTMAAGRSGAATALLSDGRVLVTGGCCDATGAPLATAEFFNSDGSFSPAPPMSFARTGQTATLLQNGQVLMAGGSVPQQGGSAALASLELFDPTSSTFALAAVTLSTARKSHAAALLSDGRVLIVGGWDGTMTSPPSPESPAPSPLSSSDIYDPATGQVTAGPAMNSPRMNFTATAQLDGKVAVIGGSDGQSDLAS